MDTQGFLTELKDLVINSTVLGEAGPEADTSKGLCRLPTDVEPGIVPPQGLMSFLSVLWALPGLAPASRAGLPLWPLA